VNRGDEAVVGLRTCVWPRLGGAATRVLRLRGGTRHRFDGDAGLAACTAVVPHALLQLLPSLPCRNLAAVCNILHDQGVRLAGCGCGALNECAFGTGVVQALP